MALIKNIHIKHLIFSIAVVLVAVAIFVVLLAKEDSFPVTITDLPAAAVYFDDEQVNVRVANTPESFTQGLSNTKGLDDGTGLLFAFPKTGRYGFWMKDMNYPIDIIWFNEDLEVVFIKENASPESYPETFYPDEESLYVLEVNAGFVEEEGIEEGDVMRVDRY